jgi:6-phosphogluconolactonase
MVSRNKHLVCIIVLINCFFSLIGFSQAKQKNGNLYVYVSSRNSNAIVIYKMDESRERLFLVDSTFVNGGPSILATDPKQNFLYVGQRTTNAFSAFRINHKNGKISFLNSISAVDNPVNISTDKTGKYLLSVYYAAGKSAIYLIGSDGSLKENAIKIYNNYVNPHSILTDASNKFLFVADKGGDKIFQYKFNQRSGEIIQTDSAEVITPKGTEPRHFVFYEKKSIVYFVNETNNTVTAYNFNRNNGTLKQFQNISTLPEKFSGKTKRQTST